MTLPILERPGQRAYPPRRSALTGHFWDQLAAGRFATTECAACSRMTFPPKSFCPHCWSREVRWRDVPTGGAIYTQTVVHIAPAIFAHEAPYRLCIFDLDAGIRIATRLVDADSDVMPGTRGELVALRYADGPMFGVRPVRG